ncbi:MAG: transporter substrate-binding domain-containing protein, partial [Alphaproteobacteria bacterium]|nr:transporter substrate-binding domain-containing protein [Alphaproteobacteria bacterium]
FYSGMQLFVRSGDTRFDDNVGKINNPRYRIATIDGEMSSFVQASDFPKASVLSMPDGTDISMACESVADGKADVAILDKSYAALYLKRNPGRLRAVAGARPIRIFENTWALAYGSARLQEMLNVAVKTMVYSGYVDKVLKKYEAVPNSFYRAALPIMQ